MSETSAERFKRLAERRVTRCIRDIRLVGNLGNRNNYSYSSGDADKIFRTLERELKVARARFDADSQSDNIEFQL